MEEGQEEKRWDYVSNRTEAERRQMCLPDKREDQAWRGDSVGSDWMIWPTLTACVGMCIITVLPCSENKPSTPYFRTFICTVLLSLSSSLRYTVLGSVRSDGILALDCPTVSLCVPGPR